MLRITTLAALLALASGAREAAAQRRASGPPGTESNEVNVIARLGTKSYTSNIAGTCKHEPSASIYDIPAALYLIEAAGAATAELRKEGAGGTLELKGKDAKGTPLNLTISCPTFAGVIAEGA